MLFIPTTRVKGGTTKKPYDFVMKSMEDMLVISRRFSDNTLGKAFLMS